MDDPLRSDRGRWNEDEDPSGRRGKLFESNDAILDTLSPRGSPKKRAAISLREEQARRGGGVEP